MVVQSPVVNDGSSYEGGVINIHIFDYLDSQFSRLFSPVPLSPDNQDSTTVHFVFCFRSMTEVSVSHVDSPAHFFIHHKHNWDTIDALSTKLNEFYQVR